MYEVTYLSENGAYYFKRDIEADSKEEAKEKFIKETGVESWRIESIVEIEED